MPRAVVVPALAKAVRREPDEDNPTFGGSGGRSSGDLQEASDGYAARLVKYIPGEALVVFLPLSSVPGIKNGQLMLVTGGALLGAVVWAINRNARLEVALRQRWWLVGIYTVIAFGAWALGTSPNLDDLVGVAALTATIIMAIGAVVLPGVDELIAHAMVSRAGR